MSNFTESEVEDVALSYFEELGYTILHGPDIAPGEPNAERNTPGDVILEGRLRFALAQINPQIPPEALDEVVRQVLRSETQNLIENNRRFHRLLVDGVPVSYQQADRTVHDQAWLIDWDNPTHNDWLAVNQFTVIEHQNRRPDIVVFVNGLPLAVLELKQDLRRWTIFGGAERPQKSSKALVFRGQCVSPVKNAASENADIAAAFNQLQTYKKDIPSLFTYNEALVISDGLTTRIGTLTAKRDRFMPWRIPPRPAEVLPFPTQIQPIAADSPGTYRDKAEGRRQKAEGKASSHPPIPSSNPPAPLSQRP